MTEVGSERQTGADSRFGTNFKEAGRFTKAMGSDTN